MRALQLQSRARDDSGKTVPEKSCPGTGTGGRLNAAHLRRSLTAPGAGPGSYSKRMQRRGLALGLSRLNDVDDVNGEVDRAALPPQTGFERAMESMPTRPKSCAWPPTKALPGPTILSTAHPLAGARIVWRFSSAPRWTLTRGGRGGEMSSARAQDLARIAPGRTPASPVAPAALGMCLAIPAGMNALYAAPLGIAAAIVATLTDATAQAADEHPQQAPAAPPTAALAPELAPALPAPDLLAPELAEAAARLEASDPAKLCDDKCKVLRITEATLPNTGAADLLSVVLEPEEHSLSIPKSDGTPVVTFTVLPTKVARGEGLVATGKF